MSTKTKTLSVTLSEEAMNLIKAEALKDDRSARSWLDRFIRAALPLQPQNQLHPTLPATQNNQRAHSHAPDIDPVDKAPSSRPQPAHNHETNRPTTFADPILAMWESESDD